MITTINIKKEQNALDHQIFKLSRTNNSIQNYGNSQVSFQDESAGDLQNEGGQKDSGAPKHSKSWRGRQKKPHH